MTAPVTFDYNTWVAGFSVFAGCSSAQGQAFFDRACGFCANEACNPMSAVVVGSTTLLAQALYLLTSHIAWMNAPRDPQGNPAQSGRPAPSVVGRLSNGSEGSVSAAFDWKGGGSPSEEWYTQTPFGAEYWQLTAKYRQARYLAMPTMVGQFGAFPTLPGFVNVWRR